MKTSFTLKALLIAVMIQASSCQKDFLDTKPNQSLLIPSSAADYEALLNHYNIINTSPFLTIVSTDDINATAQGYTSLPVPIKNSYTWNADIYQGTAVVTDWNTPFQAIYYANIVLDGTQNGITGVPAGEVSALRARALFLRAIKYFELSQQFCAPYDETTAGQLPGIPIRLQSDVMLRPGRGTVKETYARIISDLKEAIRALPESAAYKTIPVKAAGLALLARVYLATGNYDEALGLATQCLALRSALLNYNELPVTAARPFPASFKDGNAEVIYYSTAISTTPLTNPSVLQIDPALYSTYGKNDLRRSAFFTSKSGGVVFKGNYTGGSGVFTGIATDEVYLIRAECYARKNDAGAALKDLNTLLSKRFVTGSFTPYTGGDAESALQLVLTERRKELVYRNLRWSDLRRLNLNSATAVQLERNINGQRFSLPPGSKRYVFPLPDAEVMNSGIPQNER